MEHSGRSGGYYERHDALDKVCYNSDDEKYDEFGRKKKIKTKEVPGPTGRARGRRRGVTSGSFSSVLREEDAAGSLNDTVSPSAGILDSGQVPGSVSAQLGVSMNPAVSSSALQNSHRNIN